MRTTAIAAALAVLATGCAQGPAALTVPEALETEGEVVVEGYVFGDTGGTRLCEAAAESLPPQCGGASLVIEGAGADDFSDLEREDDYFWSGMQRRVRGTVDGDVITVTDPDY